MFALWVPELQEDDARHALAFTKFRTRHRHRCRHLRLRLHLLRRDTVGGLVDTAIVSNDPCPAQVDC